MDCKETMADRRIELMLYAAGGYADNDARGYGLSKDSICKILGSTTSQVDAVTVNWIHGVRHLTRFPSDKTGGGARCCPSSRYCYQCLFVLCNETAINVCGFKVNDPPFCQKVLGQLIRETIPRHVVYAASHLMTHLIESSIKLNVSQELEEMLAIFTSMHLLSWLEILVLTGSLPVVVNQFLLLEKWMDQILPTSRSRWTATQTLFYDAYRLMCAYYTIIEHGPLLLYRAALPWCPQDTLLYKTYADRVRRSVHGVPKVYNGDKTWTRVLSSHRGDAVHQVWFSECGKYLMSLERDQVVLRDRSTLSRVHGCAVDAGDGYGEWERGVLVQDLRGARILDWNTGKCLWRMDDVVKSVWRRNVGRVLVCLSKPCEDGMPQYSVKMVDLGGNVACEMVVWQTEWWFAMVPLDMSKDGKMVAIVQGGMKGLNACLVGLYDGCTGSLVGMLNGHTGSVNAVSFSSDGSYIVTGSEDQTVRVWDTRSSVCVKTFSHAQSVISVSYSPTSNRILSASCDGMVCLRELGKEKKYDEPVAAFRAPNILDIVFSTDGFVAATRSFENVIALWDVGDGLH
ncbi:quinon protein alcohol dehydrogenase-like superfamily [Chytridium lagenaria]|nr:quinon protein alcohol dehydrogenase-like superfamily [Chytridium lagenaria]